MLLLATCSAQVVAFSISEDDRATHSTRQYIMCQGRVRCIEARNALNDGGIQIKEFFDETCRRPEDHRLTTVYEQMMPNFMDFVRSKRSAKVSCKRRVPNTASARHKTSCAFTVTFPESPMPVLKKWRWPP